jgi:hypothetical protein
VSYSLCPSHPPCLDHSNYTWRRVQVMNLLIMQFSSISYHFISLRSKYSSQCLILRQVITSNYSATASLLFLHQLFPGNGFSQWRFFSFTLPGSIFTAYRAELPTNRLCPVFIKFRHGPRRNPPFPNVTLLVRADSLPRERVYRAVAQKWFLFTQSSLSNGSIHHNIIPHLC